ncbi:MAG TPA: Trm112 family protein [Gemmataceae bacterium]|nr:Trm112 family protein [Gemmataceae bacterium]
MINPELLEILRCPLDPSRTRLHLEGEHLICEQCRLQFPIRDGFPVLVVEEAELPPGCQSLQQLPCQREKSAKS